MPTNINGGIHPKTPWPYEGGGVEAAWAEFRPEKIYLSMCEGDEAPCQPAVEVGERVRVHQVIGKAGDKKSVNIHSGVSGTVAAIRDEKNPVTGSEETVVEIHNDGLDEFAPLQSRFPETFPGRDELKEILRESGIVGMGGAAFPSHAKLGDGGGLDALIVNGAECEPLLDADGPLMVARPEAVLDGSRLVMAALGIPKAVIGIERDMPDAIAAMRGQTAGDKSVRVEILPHLYPMGGEKQLILRITGREVPAGKLPSDAGVVVFNVATLTAVSDAVRRGIPLTHRLCSVVGDVAHPRTIRFPVGSRASDVIAFCGGWVGEPSRLILGGPMMGKASKSADASLIKTTNGLLLINRAHDAARDERPCIRCDQCSEACPMRLMPQFLDDAGKREDWQACLRLSADSCINCGCCSYVCPSFIPLAANITKTAKKVKSLRKESK